MVVRLLLGTAGIVEMTPVVVRRSTLPSCTRIAVVPACYGDVGSVVTKEVPESLNTGYALASSAVACA